MNVEIFALRAIKTSLENKKPNLGIIALCIMQSDSTDLEKLFCANACAHIIASPKFFDAVTHEMTASGYLSFGFVTDIDYLESNNSRDIRTCLGIDKDGEKEFFDLVGDSATIEDIYNVKYPLKYKVYLLLMQSHWIARQ